AASPYTTLFRSGAGGAPVSTGFRCRLRGSAAGLGHQQLAGLLPVEFLAPGGGFGHVFIQQLVLGYLLIGHEVQAVTAEVPEQVAGDQVGDLGVAADDLADDLLATVQ